MRTLPKQSYGFRDIEFLKLKIKAIYRTKYQLCGCALKFHLISDILLVEFFDF